MLLGSRDKVLSCPKDIKQGRWNFTWYLSIFSLLCSPPRWHWPSQLWRFVMGVNVGSSVHVGKCGKALKGKFERPSIRPRLTLGPYILWELLVLKDLTIAKPSSMGKIKYYGKNEAAMTKKCRPNHATLLNHLHGPCVQTWPKNFSILFLKKSQDLIAWCHFMIYKICKKILFSCNFSKH